ncbi:MAG: family 10 glycosylhydrolase [Bacteroidaceae bacterium]|nr:family 10 glycosylhydrolase [Bacteroidaceae bacterium]
MRLKYFSLLMLAFLLLSCASKKNLDNCVPEHPKREFRGAWIQAVNGQFTGMSEPEMKKYLTDMLDNLQKVNVNAVIFQVRVEGDALYESRYEPWSRFLTGVQGQSPGWDPLAFMVDECHKRNMELHAWINPYRARTKGTTKVAANHLSAKKPGDFIRYEGQLYFNPSLQCNRDHICGIVRDILNRYDVDGLHIDDYFYPYPVAGKEFADGRWFKNSGAADKGEWRRENVNSLIHQLHRTVREVKPWVKFGVSPFGIYRNEGSWEFGSKTNGLQCYDDLYADVLYWIEQGWVDYCIPQVYWEIGHKAADYDTLVKWWAKYASGRPLYIGQDVQRTVKAKDEESITGNQQAEKYRLQREQGNVQGACFWDAASAANNVDGYRDYLETGLFGYPALMPRYEFIDDKAPEKVDGVRLIEEDGEKVLVWLLNRKADKDKMNAPYRYVVYCFGKGEKVKLDKVENIVAITSKPFYKLPEGLDGKYTFVVTVLDRMQNESKGYKYKVKL